MKDIFCLQDLVPIGSIGVWQNFPFYNYAVWEQIFGNNSEKELGLNVFARKLVGKEFVGFF